MRRLLSALVGVCSVVGVSSALGATVLEHDIAVTLSPSTGELTGEARLVVAPAPAGAIELMLGPDFRLEELAWLDGAKVRPVKLGEPRAGVMPGGDAPVNYWTVKLGRRGPEKTVLRARWSGKPPALTDAVRFSRDEVTAMPRGYISADGAFLSSGAVWHPTGEQVTSQFRLTANVPAAWRVVSEGRLADSGETPDGRRREIYDGVHPLEGIDLVAAPWKIAERQHEGTRIAVYTLPGTPDELAVTYLDAVAGYIDRFSRRIGPHVWPQFVVAEHILPTGYGMPSFTLLGGQVMRLPFIVKTSLGHEVLHDWWGNGVYVDWASGNWCEGLTTYFADHEFARETAPGGDVDYRRQILRDYAEYVGRVSDERPVAAFRERHDRAERALGYGKVAMIFHMLRREVGDAAFESAIRAFYAGWQFRRASWADVEAVFARVAGRDLSWFFAQWVARPGAPDVRFDAAPVAGRREGPGTIVDVRLSASPGWRLSAPVDLELTAAGGPPAVVRATAALVDGAGVASARIPGEVEKGAVLLDPEVDVFRRLAPAEIPPTLARALAAPPDLVIVGTARGPDVQESAKTAAATLAKGRPVRTDTDVSAAEIAAARRLWVVGGCAEDSAIAALVRDKLPAEVNLAADRFSMRGKEASGPEAAAVVVFEPGAPGEGAVVALDALSASAMTALGRRVVHYGKYSYLLFAGDRPLVREVAAPASVPRVTFGRLP